MNTKVEKLLLVTLLCLGFFVRLYGFSNPIADWHSWRQVDTSAVSKNFVQNGFDVLHPRFDDLSNVPSGKDNPAGLRFVEFPLYNIAQAGLFSIFPLLTIEQWGRMVSIIASLVSGLFLYLLVKKYANPTAGLLTTFFYLLLPFNVYYSRTILPDISMVAAMLGGIYFFSRWADTQFKLHFLNSNMLLAFLFTTAAFLLKPYALFFTLPFFWIAYDTLQWSFFKKWQLWIFLIISILPLILWRVWMQQYPEGIPANDWLFNGGNIRFKGAYFYWIFADRIGRLILGYWGIALLMIGILVSVKKNTLFFISFLVSSLLYLTIIARGNVQHDYYQILIVPTLCIFMGLGANFLIHPVKDFTTQKISLPVLTIMTVFTFLFGWYFIRDYYNINNWSIVEAGKKVDEIVPKDAKVLALYNGDTTFLYHTNRRGWASFQKSLPEMITLGAEYLVQVNPTQSDVSLYTTEYTVVASTSSYIVVDLK